MLWNVENVNKKTGISRFFYYLSFFIAKTLFF